jgi:NitT/TauT family transport system permease protein
LLAGRYPAVARHTDPIIRLFYSIPSIALFPIFLVWFGLDEGFRLALVFFSAVFPMIITAQAGVTSVDPVLVDLARVSKATERGILMKIVVPSVLVYIAAGFKVAIGRAIVTTVGIEILTSIRGLGGMVSTYGYSFQTAKYFAPLIATSILSFAAYYVGDRLEKRFSKWRPISVR